MVCSHLSNLYSGLNSRTWNIAFEGGIIIGIYDVFHCWRGEGYHRIRLCITSLSTYLYDNDKI